MSFKSIKPAEFGPLTLLFFIRICIQRYEDSQTAYEESQRLGPVEPKFVKNPCDVNFFITFYVLTNVKYGYRKLLQYISGEFIAGFSCLVLTHFLTLNRHRVIQNVTKARLITCKL